MLTERLLAFSTLGAEWVLWLLIVLSMVSLAAVADRAILYFRTREDLLAIEPALIGALARGDLKAALEAVRQDGLVRNVIRAGLNMVAEGRCERGMVEQAMLGALSRERARFEARLTPLGTIGNNAPFVGLFGTVLGIIQAFRTLGEVDQSQAATSQIVMGSIGEALVATAVGIAVAIPAVAAFNWAKASVAGRVMQAESLMRAVLAGLDRIRCPAADDRTGRA